MKRFCTSCVNKEIQIKIVTHPSGWPESRMLTIPNPGQDVECQDIHQSYRKLQRAADTYGRNSAVSSEPSTLEKKAMDVNIRSID